MEVHDFEQEHLESVLREDDEPSSREAEPTWSVTHTQTCRRRSGAENNTSKERYDLLPDYAQVSFVKPNHDISIPPPKEQASLTIQDSKEDVEQDLPKDIKTPVTKRARDMVRMTAAKCVSAPQLEVLLKVRQASNPEFAFLYPHDECHAYYVWLKEQERQEQKEETASNDMKERDEKGGLSLLDIYSSSSDEESSSLKTTSKNVVKEQANDTREVPQVPSASDTPEIPQLPCASAPVNDDNDKRPRRDDDNDDNDAAVKRARRLKRAKLMRGHYRLQLMGSDTKNIPNKP